MLSFIQHEMYRPHQDFMLLWRTHFSINLHQVNFVNCLQRMAFEVLDKVGHLINVNIKTLLTNIKVETFLKCTLLFNF